MAIYARNLYTGTDKSLVIGIDVGMTLSGVSYTVLEPGKVPRIQPVVRFPGQREEKFDSKVPSVVCYDQDGHVIAVGAETDPETNPVLSGIEGVRRAEWFKLRLRPPHLAADKKSQFETIWSAPEPAEEIDDYHEVSDEDESENDILLDIEGVVEVVEPKDVPAKEINDYLAAPEEEEYENDILLDIEGVGAEVVEPEEIDDYLEASDEEEYANDILLDIEGVVAEVVEPEPPNKKKRSRSITDEFKTAVQVFADFLHYLFKSAKEYIIVTEEILDPTFAWSSIERNTYFVLTHPNGWEGKQQSQMRDAAVAAGLVDRSTATDQITFLTEGEAGLHFCLDKIPELYQEDGGILVVDCGGGTIDLSAYSRIEKGGFKEIVLPDCLLQGSIFVTSRARNYFKGKFKGSQFGTDDAVEAMARAFDKPGGVKCTFRDPNTNYYVKFGRLRDNDWKYGISGGKFKVEGAQVAEFFEPAIQDITNGIINQCRNAQEGSHIKCVLLVGGFGRSDYLYARLCDYLKSSGIVVRRPDSAHLNKAVADGAVSWYLHRSVSTRVARFSYGVTTYHPFDDKDPDHLDRESTKVTRANGKIYIPGIFATILKRGSEVSEETRFCQHHTLILTPGQFAKWTTISTSLKCYRGKAAYPPKWLDREPGSFHDTCTIQAEIKQNMTSRKGIKRFYKLDSEIVILFGFTELKAYIAWKEDGVEKRTGASIFYD